jgi:hypothetical protein
MDNSIVMFCANDQVETTQALTIDGNGEIVLTCPCGRFTKLPAGTDAAGLAAYIAAHKEENDGQISVASLDAKKADLIAGLQQDAPADVTPDTPPAPDAGI